MVSEYVVCGNKNCDNVFKKRTPTHKYCSKRCKKASARRRNNEYKKQYKVSVGLATGAVTSKIHPRYYTCMKEGRRCKHYDGGCFTEMGEWQPKCQKGEKFEPEPKARYRQRVQSPFGRINMPGMV